MNRISEYFGSGQSLSGTVRSSWSAISRTAPIAGTTLCWTYLARSSASSTAGWLLLAESSAPIRSTNRSTSPATSERRYSTPADAPAAPSSPR